MIFQGLAPMQALYLFGGGVALITILYLIRFRRKGITVSFGPMWDKVLGRTHSPWRKAVSWFLQCLALFLLCAALTDPVEPAEKIPEHRTVLIVDISASMGAKEGDATRLGNAKEILSGKISDAAPNESIMIIAAGDAAAPLSGFTGDTEKLLAALDGVEAAAGSGDIVGAFRVATVFFKGIRRERPEGSKDSIYVVSDQYHPFPAFMEGLALEVRQTVVGTGAENVAITAFGVRERLFFSLGYEILVEVENFGGSEASFDLAIHTENYTLGKIPMRLPPGEQARKMFQVESLKGEKLMATLADVSYGEENLKDGLAVDDRAFAITSPVKTPTVLLVTRGNLFLETALKINPSIEYVSTSPEAFNPAGAQSYDLIFFDGHVPESPVPTSHVLIDPDGTGISPSTGSAVVNPLLTDWDAEHPVLAESPLKDIHSRNARCLVPAKGDRVLIGTYEGALALAREEKGLKSVVMGFDLNETDLPLRVAFPLMVHNIVHWVTGKKPSSVEPGYHVGDRLRLEPGAGVEEVTFTAPEGTERSVSAQDGEITVLLDQPGFYNIQAGRRNLTIPVNFSDRDESTIAWDGPRPSWSRKEAKIIDFPTGKRYRDLFILALLGLLMIDWFLFHRAKL